LSETRTDDRLRGRLTAETDATNQFRRGCRWQWNPYNYTPKQAAAHVALGQTWGRYARTAVATRTLLKIRVSDLEAEIENSKP